MMMMMMMIVATTTTIMLISPSNSGTQPGSQMRYSASIFYFTVIID
jgi:hypothetical protein